MVDVFGRKARPVLAPGFISRLPGKVESMSDREMFLSVAGIETAASVIECLLFRCSGQLLACETSQTARVLRPPRLVPLPETSGVVAGLFNYRGRIIGAIDINPLLDLGRATASGWQWIVVLKGKQFLTGLLIDDVLGIETIETDSLVNTAADHSGFLPKIFVVNDQTVSLLSVDTLLANPAVVVNQ
jgi:chemotaxis signal transduction protein